MSTTPPPASDDRRTGWVLSVSLLGTSLFSVSLKPVKPEKPAQSYDLSNNGSQTQIGFTAKPWWPTRLEPGTLQAEGPNA